MNISLPQDLPICQKNNPVLSGPCIGTLVPVSIRERSSDLGRGISFTAVEFTWRCSLCGRDVKDLND